MMKQLETILWKDRAGVNFDYCSLFQVENGFAIEGIVLSTYSGKPCRIDYQVICGQDWQTKSVDIKIDKSGEKQQIILTVDQQCWLQDEVEIKECRGCRAIDLGFTPATNTIAIRQLGLAERESAEIVACWLKYPEFTIQPYPQRYSRLSKNRYLYESGEGGYKAELVVSEHGLVTDYEGYWQAIATG